MTWYLRRHLLGVTAGFACIVLGLAVMVGWFAGWRMVTQIQSQWVPMQFNTALCFALAGYALRRRALKLNGTALEACSLFIAFIGAMTIAEHATGANLGIDELFMRHDILVGTSSPGRMAPNTAGAFVVAGVGLPIRHRIGHRVCAGFVVGLGAVALIGYMTGAEDAYGWGQYTRMAAHTAAGLVTLGLGWFLVAPPLRKHSLPPPNCPVVGP